MLNVLISITRAEKNTWPVVARSRGNKANSAKLELELGHKAVIETETLVPISKSLLRVYKMAFLLKKYVGK